MTFLEASEHHLKMAGVLRDTNGIVLETIMTMRTWECKLHNKITTWEKGCRNRETRAEDCFINLLSITIYNNGYKLPKLEIVAFDWLRVILS